MITGKLVRTTMALAVLAAAAACSDGDGTVVRQTPNDVCEDIDCGNHGACQEVSEEATCVCEHGYEAEGLTCKEKETKIDPPDPCEGVSCGDNGSCEVVEGAATCACDAGYAPDGLSCVSRATAFFTGGEVHGSRALRIGGDGYWDGAVVNMGSVNELGPVTAVAADGQGTDTALQVAWTAAGEVYVQNAEIEDMSAFNDQNTAVRGRIRVDTPPADGQLVVVRVDYDGGAGEVNVSSALREFADGNWHDICIPLQELINAGLDTSKVKRPFLMFTAGPMAATIEDVRWVPGQGDLEACQRFGPYKPDLDILWVYKDGVNSDFVLSGWTPDPVNPWDQETDLGDGHTAWLLQMRPPMVHLVGQHDGRKIDLSNYDVEGALLKFDMKVTDYFDDSVTDIMVKFEQVWPNISDMLIFSEILGLNQGERPALDQWIPVSVPVSQLADNPNNNDPAGNVVDITKLKYLFELEALGGKIDVLVNNVRFEK